MIASNDADALRSTSVGAEGDGLSVPKPPPTDSGSAAVVGWLTVTALARRTGISRRTLQHRARSLATRGLAVRLRSRGKRVWWVAPEADPGLFNPDHAGLAALDGVPESCRVRAYRRERWRREFWRDCAAHPGASRTRVAAQVVARARAEGDRCSIRSLQAWERAYLAAVPGGGTIGVAGLLDHYRRAGSAVGKDRSVAGRSPEAVEFFHSLFRTQQKLPASRCHRLTLHEASRRGWSWPASYSATTAWLRAYDNKAVTFLLRHGYSAYLHSYGEYVEQDYSGVAPGDLFVADSHLVKAICHFQGRLVRPWLIANMDAATRCVVGWTLSPYANQDAILDALRASYVRWAIPRRQKIDNGRDYGARLFHGATKAERSRARREAQKAQCDRPEWRGILPELGIDVQFALPFNPQSKVVERWFRTLTDQCVRMLVSFVDTDPARRPEAHRAVIACTKDLRCARSAVPTFEELRDRIRGYIAEYHDTPHRGEGMALCSPREAWQTRAVRLRRAPADALRILMQVRGRCKVGANGVRLQTAGSTIGYGRDDETLRRWKGREVLVAVDHEDVSQAIVFTPDRQLLTIVPMNDRIAPFGADAQQLSDAIRTVRRARGDRKRALRTAAARMRTPQDILREHQARQVRDTAEGPPPTRGDASLKPVDTGFEQASKAIEGHRSVRHAEVPRARGLAEVTDSDSDGTRPPLRALPDFAGADEDEAKPASILERLEEAVRDE